MSKVSAILLAAGLSSRMQGAYKLTLPWGESTIFETCLNQLLKTDLHELIIVVGKNAQDLIHKVPPESEVKIVINPDYETGMTSSIKKGVEIASGNYYMICLADMPFISSEDFNRLIKELDQMPEGKNILVPLYKKEKGNPVVFSKQYRNQILSHSRPNGCSHLIKQNQPTVFFFETGNIRFTLDIDTPSDLDRFKL